jgi:transposase-like protein
MPDRDVILAWAERHGGAAAARRFGVPVGTVYAWRSRFRRRAARTAADAERARQAPVLAEPDPAEATIAERMAAGSCLRCGGAGRVAIPEVRRGSLLIRRAQRLPCPDCGGPRRIVQVVEHPRESWTEAQQLAGDLGAGWTPEQWGRVRAGLDPDGYRFADGDRLEPGEGRP